MKYLIIIPTYNEKENIPKLIGEILKQNDLIDVLVVDDNSPDGTGKIADKLSKENRRIKVIHRKGKLGLGSAYIEGFKYGIKNNYELIFEMDADYSHNPKYIPQLIEASHKYDLVLGSRWVKGGGVVGWPWNRFLSSWGANLVARTLLSLKPKDITSGFRCYKKEVLKSINFLGIISSGYAFQEEMIFKTQKNGFTIGEIPIIFHDRKIGKSKMGSKEIITSTKAILKLFIMRRGVGQLVKFGIIGLSGMIVDFGLLNLFVLYFQFNVYLAAALSFTLAASNNFFWNRIWTFKEESKNKKISTQYIKYLLIMTIGFFINLLILRICLPYFGNLFHLDINNPLVLNLSKIIATIIVMLWNFFGSKKWVFK